MDNNADIVVMSMQCCCETSEHCCNANVILLQIKSNQFLENSRNFCDGWFYSGDSWRVHDKPRDLIPLNTEKHDQVPDIKWFSTVSPEHESKEWIQTFMLLNLILYDFIILTDFNFNQFCIVMPFCQSLLIILILCFISKINNQDLNF